jgi:hypothetical protein
MSNFAQLQRRPAETASFAKLATPPSLRSRSHRGKTLPSAPTSELPPPTSQQMSKKPGVGFSLAHIPIDPLVQSPPEAAESHQKNIAGLPNSLKAGIERVSGLSLDDVSVHYASPRPAQLQALAYAQGTEIHVGPGQEQHLAHEAWHVVQQKQGRVQPTLQAEGVSMNDKQELEEEADAMGTRAIAGTPLVLGEHFARSTTPASSPNALTPVQRVTTRSEAKKEEEKKKAAAKKPTKKKASYTAAARLKRASKRAETRIERNGRIKTGRYRTRTGPITISGGVGGNQRMTQSRGADYGGKTFGRGYAPYSSVQKDLPEKALPALVDPKAKLPKAMTDKEKLATSIATGLTYISEPDRAPGYDKAERAIINQRITEGTKAPHPFDSSLNVAVSSAREARDFMSGATALTKAQTKVIDEYMSSSSDSEDEAYAARTGIVEEMDEDEDEE